MFRMLKLALPAFLVLVTVAFVFGKSLFISFLDPRLTMAGFEMRVNEQAFTGFAYERHSTGQLYRLVPVWQGQRIWKELHWYEDGTRWAERDYSSGVPHGHFKSWHRNGQPQAIQAFKNGLEDGEFWSWNPRGQLVEYRRSVDGKEVAYKAFTFDQKVFYNYVYKENERVGVQAGQFCKSTRKLPN